MTQVNLLPGDVKERQLTRRLTAAAILAVGAVVALLFVVFVLEAAKVSDANHRLQAQVATNSDLQSRIDELQPVADLKAQVAAREALTAAATDGEVLWSGVLRDISMVIPDKVWLSGMDGTLNTPVQAAPVAPAAPTTPGATPSPGSTPSPAAPVAPVGPALVGTIQFQGFAEDHPSVAQWLTRLERVTGWANPWISIATEFELNGENTIEWTGSLDLTNEATARGGAR
jgi:Tfp pilus assembly protein PilN